MGGGEWVKERVDKGLFHLDKLKDITMEVVSSVFIYISTWATYRSSEATISQRTSCLVRSRCPRLETKSSSAASLHEAVVSTPLRCDIWEKGVPARREDGPRIEAASG
jgi:hypothetical protein